MTPIVLPYALPAAESALLWGAGALGTGLATLGIIDNRDAIANYTLNMLNGIRSGVGNTILRISYSMSPRYITPSVHYEQNTMGLPTRHIAVTDAINTPYMYIEPVSTPAQNEDSSVGTDTSEVEPETLTDSEQPSAPTNNPPQLPTNNPPQLPNPRKRSGIKKAMEWAKKHPWKTTGIGLGLATAAYPTRKYVISPMFNYIGPAVGNAGSWIVYGETPFNIPAVANDSTDLWYKGSIGKVENSTKLSLSKTDKKTPPSTTQQQQNELPKDTGTVMTNYTWYPTNR